MNPCSKTTVACRGEGRQLRRARQWGRCGGQRAPPDLHLRFKLQLHPAGRPHILGLSQRKFQRWPHPHECSSLGRMGYTTLPPPGHEQDIIVSWSHSGGS
ncbi:hypothetical protein PVAP13_8NG068901 [Panicum virgatum]|uniref:Uncharacterized protein n=1 Tax=Panicum virgatum TaxID=38727 RepID=A0A8T0P222_PANVG|nr:hypothetical protein PVAP13_8NG068901 [Panicum virgatum]KAG2556221.1 hypothetical protein PVAP13_8NG068901 [Panicum virgatum]